MRLSNMLRYGLWCGVAATAEANRRHYHLKTTWLPHLLANTVTLLLPDLYHALRRLGQAKPVSPRSSIGHVDDATIVRVICDNPYYVAYMAPLALGYLLSHPRFNIYKGELAEKRWAGFGLDALPHGATALALTMLTVDTTQAAARLAVLESPLAKLLWWCDRHWKLVSGATLALATLIWELGEYRIHKHELALRGDTSRINMQWSRRDTLYDCLSNALGWGVAIALRRRQNGPDASMVRIKSAPS